MSVDLNRLFTYHRPTTDQAERYNRLSAAARTYAETVRDLTPPSAEQTLAIRSIHAASMQANAAIAVNEPSADDALVAAGTPARARDAARPRLRSPAPSGAGAGRGELHTLQQAGVVARVAHESSLLGRHLGPVRPVGDVD